jgi:quercetin dioxygenase-like cupin family protein
MKIQDLHLKDKAVSAISLFKTTDNTVMALQILAHQVLKEHVTKVPALLICLEGKVVFKNEKGVEEALTTGEYIKIEPMVKHWVEGILNSQLLLFK